MKRFTLIAAALLLVTAAMSPVMAATDMRIVGVVMTENGKPIPEAKVEFNLHTDSGKWISASSVTDMDGKYVIKDLPVSKGYGKAWGAGRGSASQFVVIERPTAVVDFRP